MDVFALAPTNVRLLRLISEDPLGARGPAIIEINLHAPQYAASVLEPGQIRALSGVT